MFSSAANTVKTKVTETFTGFFQKNDAQPQFIQPFTRFSTATELKEIADVLEQLFVKKESMKKSSDEKGLQSNEYATFATLDAILASFNNVIVDFNQVAIKPDVLSNMKDIYDLLLKLKPIASISEQQQATLNSVTADKLNPKSTAASAALFAAPFLPALLLGPGVIALGAGAALFLATKPVSDLLIKNGVIYFDTESKKLMKDLVELIDQSSKNLEKYHTDNKVDLGNGNLEQAAPRPA